MADGGVLVSGGNVVNNAATTVGIGLAGNHFDLHRSDVGRRDVRASGAVP